MFNSTNREVPDDSRRNEPFDERRFPHFEALTDTGNAQRLVNQHGKDICFVANWGKWLIWDGTRWSADVKGQIFDLAKKTVLNIINEIPSEGFSATRLEQHGKNSQSEKSLKAMISLAKTHNDVAITSDQLDSNHWNLNLLNGTVHLRSGILHPHNPKDLITKLCPVRFVQNEDTKEWEDFLNQVVNGDQELKAFLQRAIGYSLTGVTDEEKAFFIFGTGATGKSTFLEAVKSVLGDYAATANFDTFLHKQNSGIGNDIARLEGKRLVISIEMEEGKRLAESVVKSLTGSDTVTARFLYSEFTEFKPQFKLFMSANHRPLVKHDDEGIWRRILIIPFSNVIPKEKRDPLLKKRLCNPKKMGSSILKWAVQGCLEWQTVGLGVPPKVEEATNSYRQDMEPIREFLEDCCILNERARTPVSALYREYKKWADNSGERYPLNQKKFGEALKTKGLVQQKVNHGRIRVWEGIELSGGGDEGDTQTSFHTQ